MESWWIFVHFLSSDRKGYCCISYLIITIYDEIYSSNYLKHEFHLRSNFMCYFLSILSFTTIILSTFTVNFLTLIRYFVVKRPLDPKFHNKKAFNRLNILALLQDQCQWEGDDNWDVSFIVQELGRAGKTTIRLRE